MTDPRKPIFDAVKAARGGKGWIADEVVLFDKALDALGVPHSSDDHQTDPPWITIARKLIGTTEIPGPRHNSWIATGWKRLGAAWFNDDETPWCGLFVAHCIDAAGLSYPKAGGLFARALTWASWGKPCPHILGAVAVFKRDGGGHVGFLVGESSTHVYILGGNQKNAVNIMPIAKDRLHALRWPNEMSLGTTIPPKMIGGIVSVNES